MSHGMHLRVRRALPCPSGGAPRRRRRGRFGGRACEGNRGAAVGGPGTSCYVEDGLPFSIISPPSPSAPSLDFRPPRPRGLGRIAEMAGPAADAARQLETALRPQRLRTWQRGGAFGSSRVSARNDAVAPALAIGLADAPRRSSRCCRRRPVPPARSRLVKFGIMQALCPRGPRWRRRDAASAARDLRRRARCPVRAPRDARQSGRRNALDLEPSALPPTTLSYLLPNSED